MKEGMRAGLLGAAAVALWFFVVDLLMGRPLATPTALGESLLGVLGLDRGQSTTEIVVLYTVWHVVAFMLVAVLTAWMLNVSEREPSHLAGLFLLFAVFEAAFYLYLYLLSRNGRFVFIAWYQIGAANLLAAFVMGRYLFGRHPGALHRMSEALAGR
jgi:hypothetical protein